ncbi:MAG: MFS transporter [Geminicoccaceae bacterium]|nr:MFS transporter [Geminicoccaceae bacterium]
MTFVHLRPVLGPLLTTLLVQTLVTGTALMPPVLVTLIAPDLGLGEGASGYWIALLYFGAVASSFVAGRCIQALGALTVSLASLVLSAAGLWLLALGALPLAVFGALVAGLGYGATTPASSEILARRTPPEIRALVFSLKQTGVPLGGVLAGALGPSLALRLGWPAALALGGLAAVLAALALLPLRRRLDEGPAQAGRARPKGLKLVLRDPPLRFVALSSFGFSAVQLCVTSYLVVLLVRRGDLDLVTAGIVFSAAQIAGVLGRIALGHLADRSGRPALVLATLGLASTLLLGAAGLMAPSWAFALKLGLGAALGLASLSWNGIFLAEVARLAPVGQAGAVTGGTLAVTYAGVVVGPPLFALALTGLGWEGACLLAGGLGVMAAALILAAVPAEARRRPG